MTEIAKALSMNTKILIMDEPTSTLTKAETEKLFEMISKLKKSGITIIYISHRMDEIFQVCDRITVLRNGKNVLTKKCSDMALEEVINAIIGGSMRKSFEWTERSIIENRKPLLEAKNLKSGDKVKDVSFSLYEGEILGIAGLMGSGRSETAKVVFGIDPPLDNGEIYIKGEMKKINSPSDAINCGMGLVPEDRRSQGLILGHSVKENTILPGLPIFQKRQLYKII
ncbi:ABC-type sugar transport system [Gracilibacillus boraciitolerans JCM 21714]|uniref:ABC-type sugar transport system n=1 Tax=Gracilibacillus boraciitolerans JCM 21714 TaxID=1298598 RepID=W4VQI7_9BACI|nr:ATP-binding cassette domain-containing protein [Gracilibacillus boraciitolerans]GAE95029.1 ABC-type sugar transport system [Gracilibacillus boraciitolerans JCM 21714]